MDNPLTELRRLTDPLGPVWTARLRSAATLTVLVLLVVLAVRVGFSQVAQPFPQAEDPPLCTDTDLDEGDRVRPDDVTVSVLNAGGEAGLASRTLSDLNDRGFGRGALQNAPEDTPRVTNAQIWTTEGRTAAVRLILSHLTGTVRVVDRSGPAPGVVVVVGEGFGGIQDGRAQLRARGAETTCVPAVPAESVTAPVGA
jgi:hypothetical protein